MQSDLVQDMKSFLRAKTSIITTALNQSYQRHPVFGHAKRINILTPPHCIYIARLLKNCLAKHGMKSKIIGRQPKLGFDGTLHIVICPQIFKALPAHYIAFQVEQSIHHRWFTPEYFSILKKAHAVFDYSEKNVAYLKQHGIDPEKLFHLPISYLDGFSAEFQEEEKTHDILFYGDASNARRKRFLDAIKQHHHVTVVHGLYGDAVHREIKRAKIVINIHYYDDALLETTRIYESLSLGAMVISEEGIDQNEHSELSELVDFVAIDDTASMIDRINHWLTDEHARISRVRLTQSRLGGATRFTKAFSEFLHRDAQHPSKTMVSSEKL